MRYMYTFFNSSTTKRIDTCTRAVCITPQNVTAPYYVAVYDLLKKKPVCELRNVDELNDWIETLERAYFWSDADQKTNLENPFEAADKKANPETVKIKITSFGKQSNLKSTTSSNKPKTSAVPPVAIIALGQAMQNGADKYGKFNWRTSEVTASVFYDAMMRHLQQWYSGENFADDSGVSHLAHLMADAAIILDAQHTNVFIDDRNTLAQSGIEPLLKVVKE